MGKLWMVGLVFFTVISDCKKDSTEPESGVPAGVAGTWYQVSQRVTSVANPSISEEIQMTWTSVLIINADGSYTATTVEDSSQHTSTGTLTFDGSTMTVHEGTDTMTLTWALVNGMLTFTEAESTWDFGSGDEAAVFVSVYSHTAP